MPQLGETVTEGTITKWYKAVGDQVARDEPLFEVSTDKVDSEVPSPAEGVLTAILVEEGDTVDVGVTLAVIGDAAGDGCRQRSEPARRRKPPGPSTADARADPRSLRRRPRRRPPRRHRPGRPHAVEPAAPAAGAPSRARRAVAAGRRLRGRTLPGAVPRRVRRGTGPLAGGAEAAQRARHRPGRRPRHRARWPDHPGRRGGGHRRGRSGHHGRPVGRPGPGSEHRRPASPVPRPHLPPRGRDPLTCVHAGLTTVGTVGSGHRRPGTRWSPSPTSGAAPPSTWCGPRPPPPTP